jgi:hypothetical protein
MSALAKLRALTRTERRLLIVSAVALPLVAAGLKVAGFARTQSMLARWSRPRVSQPPSHDLDAVRAREVARIAAIAAGRSPIRATCLPRSLWLWARLRREGIETVLRVGVNREDGTLHAHAWVEHRGRPLIDADDVAARFPTFEQDFGVSPARSS